jgi:hypothetical protein
MPGGRPSKFSEDMIEQAKFLCERGCTDAELARFFKVKTRTIYRWKALHPEFCHAIKTGGDPADERVERSLYQRAVGYETDAVKIFMPAGASEPVYAPYREHIPGEVGAAIFWLKNRRKDRWRDKTEQELTGADGSPLVPSINVTVGKKG